MGRNRIALVLVCLLSALKGMTWDYRLSHVTFLRPFTPRLPVAWRKALALALALLFKIALSAAYKPMALIPGLRNKVRSMPFYAFSTYPVQSAAVNFFDRLSPPYTFFHTKEEIVEWYENAGYERIETRSKAGRGWVAHGYKRKA